VHSEQVVEDFFGGMGDGFDVDMVIETNFGRVVI
jgi:hypothetical protein